MKRNEIIELNGKEYTLELNRDSFIQIDKICNINQTMAILNTPLYEYVDEIDDNYNPLENMVSDDELENRISTKEKVIRKMLVRSFFIWLYPNHQLTITQVEELLKPYIEDEQKSQFIIERLLKYLGECVDIRQDEKNLKPQTNN